MENPQVHVTRSFDARAAIAPRLRASWQRSERYGVPEDEVMPVFSGEVDTGSLLYECGTEVLRGLQATLANEPISLMITDSEGLVLTRLCTDASINRSLDKVHLAPGLLLRRDATRAPTGSAWRSPTGRRRWCAPPSTTAPTCADTPARRCRCSTRSPARSPGAST